MESKSTNNQQNRWLGGFLEHLWHISEPKAVPGSILGRFWEESGLHVRVIFGSNFDMFLDLFFDPMFDLFLIDFGPKFGRFFG